MLELQGQYSEEILRLHSTADYFDPYDRKLLASESSLTACIDGAPAGQNPCPFGIYIVHPLCQGHRQQGIWDQYDKLNRDLYICKCYENALVRQLTIHRAFINNYTNDVIRFDQKWTSIWEAEEYYWAREYMLLNAIYPEFGHLLTCEQAMKLNGNESTDTSGCGVGYFGYLDSHYLTSEIWFDYIKGFGNNYNDLLDEAREKAQECQNISKNIENLLDWQKWLFKGLRCAPIKGNWQKLNLVLIKWETFMPTSGPMYKSFDRLTVSLPLGGAWNAGVKVETLGMDVIGGDVSVGYGPVGMKLYGRNGELGIAGEFDILTGLKSRGPLGKVKGAIDKTRLLKIENKLEINASNKGGVESKFSPKMELTVDYQKQQGRPHAWIRMRSQPQSFGKKPYLTPRSSIPLKRIRPPAGTNWRLVRPPKCG